MNRNTSFKISMMLFTFDFIGQMIRIRIMQGIYSKKKGNTQPQWLVVYKAAHKTANMNHFIVKKNKWELVIIPHHFIPS